MFIIPGPIDLFGLFGPFGLFGLFGLRHRLMLGEIKSLASVLRVVNMSTRGCRDCPVPDCGAKYLVRLANHLANVHMLDIDQRRKYLQEAKRHPIVKRVAYKSAATDEINDNLLQQQDRVCVVSKVRQHVLKHAQVSSWQEPYTNSEEPGEKRASQSEDLPPAKKPRVVRSTASLATKPCPEFNFRHKFSLLVMGPTQSGKTYFVQQILKHNRIVYEEQKSIRIFWYYNQWQECYEELKTSLGKNIRFERGVPELSEDLCEINPRYNNIIILDDLMAEVTDSPVVSRLFTQGRHRNASVILLLQTCFLRGSIIRISAEMPSTRLSSEVLAIGNKSELLKNACSIRIEYTLWMLITKRPKNRLDTYWWTTSLTHQRISKFLQTYLANAMFITLV